MNRNSDSPRVLLLGGSGFVGSWIYRRFDTGNDFFTSEVLAPGVNAPRIDIGSRSALISVSREFDPHFIINCAGVIRGSYEEMHRAHVEGARNLVEATLTTTARLVSFGSCAEYGFDVPMPAREDGPCHPVSDYGKTKLEATHILIDSLEDVTVVRPSNVIGAHCKPPMLVGSILEQIKNGSRPVIVSDPNTVRDYIDVMDIAGLMAVCCHKFKEAIPNSSWFQTPKVINLCSQRGHSNAEVVETAFKVVRQETAVRYLNPSADPSTFIGANDLMKALPTVFANTRSLRASIRHAWEAMK
jgi:nucleoside-diphosphate-sugar epimerase